MTVPELYDLPEEMRVEGNGPIRTVTINRPREHNAVNRALHWALANVWRQLAADAEVRAVVLTGAGPAFSMGGDLDWIASFRDDVAGRNDSLREAAQIVEELIRFPLPIIAAVNGPAVGLGCSVALLCDVVLISDTAYLADPHVSVGLVAGDGGAAFWPVLTPLLRSREYLFTGDRIPAATAVELGLATRVVAADQLTAEAHRLAARIAAQPVDAVRGTKQILNMHLAGALANMYAGLAAEARTMESADHAQRIDGLLNRRAR